MKTFLFVFLTCILDLTEKNKVTNFTEFIRLSKWLTEKELYNPRRLLAKFTPYLYSFNKKQLPLKYKYKPHIVSLNIENENSKNEANINEVLKSFQRMFTTHCTKVSIYKCFNIIGRSCITIQFILAIKGCWLGKMLTYYLLFRFKLLLWLNLLLYVWLRKSAK